MTEELDHSQYVDPNVSDEYDDGTMPQSIAQLANVVVGRKIVGFSKEVTSEDLKNFEAYKDAEHAKGRHVWRPWGSPQGKIELDNGTTVLLYDGGDCCAYTELENFLEYPERFDHVITGVTSESGYERWRILCDAGDVLDMNVAWSCGNPFYYSYGFDIFVIPNTVEGETYSVLPEPGSEV